jgi:hypothetical protein
MQVAVYVAVLVVMAILMRLAAPARPLPVRSMPGASNYRPRA